MYSRVGVVVLVEPVSGSSGSASSTGLRGPDVGLEREKIKFVFFNIILFFFAANFRQVYT